MLFDMNEPNPYVIAVNKASKLGKILKDKGCPDLLVAWVMNLYPKVLVSGLPKDPDKKIG